MKKIVNSVLELVGDTPMVELERLGRDAGAVARVVAKVELFNPAGSVKDRVALAMVERAEADGVLRPGATIIEPTSGNTGVGLALVSALKGYRLILTMPETMSVERRRLVAAYGAKVVLTPGAEGMKGAIARAQALREEIPGSVILQQFENPANPARHYRTTAEEIWRDTEGGIDLFVAGVGTGGTVSGTGRRLKELNPAIDITREASKRYLDYMFRMTEANKIKKEIKQRIESVQQTRKITNAMYLISSSNLRKARRQLTDVEPYFSVAAICLRLCMVAQRS